MADEENKAVSAAKAIGLISTIFGFLEKSAIVIFMMIMERSKIKLKKAEDEKEKAKSDSEIMKKEIAIDKEADAKTDEQIVDDFLDEQFNSSSGKGTGKPN